MAPVPPSRAAAEAMRPLLDTVNPRRPDTRDGHLENGLPAFYFTSPAMRKKFSMKRLPSWNFSVHASGWNCVP